MKTMNDYTLYCTEEQTNRAIKLGCPYESPEDYSPIKLPTTQQMINWLRIQGIRFWWIDSRFECVLFTREKIQIDFLRTDNLEDYLSNFELAAIDAALDYLEKGETK